MSTNLETKSVSLLLTAYSGSAIEGAANDYTITTSPITITAGNTEGTITITVVDDAVPEISKTVVVTMETPTNATQGATVIHTATITDADT